MAVQELRVPSVGRVEGDLDVKVMLEDNRVVDAWTEASMFRGFEIILKGKDPQAGLIVTPRICGICGGSHLTKSSYALDVAWKTEVPANAHLIRSIAQAAESMQSIPRWFYALFGIDLVNKNYAKSSMYDEAVRRWAPFVGRNYEIGVELSGKPVEVYAIFGGQWPHSSFMVPGGVMCGPVLSDVTRATAILEYWKENWLERVWLGGPIESYLEVTTWDQLLAWIDANDSQRNSDLAFFIRYSMDIGLDKYGQGVGKYLATGTFMNPEKYQHPTIEARNGALISRSGIYDGEHWHDFDQARVYEDHTHAFYRGSGVLHPFDGRTEPLDPEEGKRDGKYTWAKAPRYDIPGHGLSSMEAGSYARQIIAGREGAEPWQDYDPLFINMHRAIGPSVMTRVLSRMHEAPKYFLRVKEWLGQLDLHGKFYIKPEELPEGRGFGATEAIRGALADWIVLKNGKIENYQVVTPTAWNVSPRDGNEGKGPIELSLIGSPVQEQSDPVELGHVARSFDSCLVCTVHAYDAKTHQQLAKFRVDGLH